MNHSEQPPLLLKRTTAPALALRLQPGTSPTILMLPGFRSTMCGDKARTLAEWGAQRGQCVARFDYRGFGESGGVWDQDARIGNWIADALDVIDLLPAGPVILVGSSMGAWIATRAALARPGRVAGLLTIAAAPDFTHEVLPTRFAQAHGGGDLLAYLAQHGVLLAPSAYEDGPYPISAHFVTEAAPHRVLTHPTLAFAGPVRMLHGLADDEVPWPLSARLLERLASPDARLTLVKGGNHRLSTAADLALMCQMVDELTQTLSAG